MLSSCLRDGCILPVSSHGGERDSESSCIPSYKDSNPILRTTPSWPHLNHRLPVQIPPLWGLGLQNRHFWGDTVQSLAITQTNPDMRGDARECECQESGIFGAILQAGSHTCKSCPPAGPLYLLAQPLGFWKPPAPTLYQRLSALLERPGEIHYCKLRRSPCHP